MLWWEEISLQIQVKRYLSYIGKRLICSQLIISSSLVASAGVSAPAVNVHENFPPGQSIFTLPAFFSTVYPSG